jgi:hypothetical protein
VRPCDLLAVFIQLINELNSFLVRVLVFVVVVEEEEEGEPPPRVRPLALPVLLLLLLLEVFFFGAANAIIYEWLKLAAATSAKTINEVAIIIG